MRGLTLTSCFLIAGILFALASTAFGDEMDALADKALKASGMTGQLDHLGPALISAVPADVFPNTKMQSEASAFVKKNAGKAALTAIVRSEVRTRVDKETLEKIIAFYESKLGRKVARLHDTALEPTMLKNIREGRKVLASSEESRLGPLKRLVAADRVPETNRALLKTVIRGLLEGYAGDTPETTNDQALIEKKMRIMETAIRTDARRTEELALAAYAYSYRTLEDKELEELAAFRESLAAVNFGAAVREGLQGAVYKTARSFAEAATTWRTTPSSGDSGAAMDKSRRSNAAGSR